MGGAREGGKVGGGGREGGRKEGMGRGREGRREGEGGGGRGRERGAIRKRRGLLNNKKKEFEQVCTLTLTSLILRLARV